MKTGERDSSDPHAPSKVNTPGEVNWIRRLMKHTLVPFMALFTTSTFERLLFTQVDNHSVLHYVIFMSFYMLIYFLYYKYKPC